MHLVILVQCKQATYTINAASPPSVTIDELLYASYSVQAYVEANHELPANVTIVEKTISMSQFLQLINTAAINLNTNITTSHTHRKLHFSTQSFRNHKYNWKSYKNRLS
ncbi:MAG: hypothetical protein ACOX07_00090 [Methanobacterium sp.]|uniref:hypothetical protein n=1 Tax=Methanobacterium sp. TaxID=2164 RepID=UPI003D8C0841